MITGLVVCAVWVLGWILSLVPNARMIGKICLRDYSACYPDGEMIPDGSDVAFLLLMSAVWPLGVPMLFLCSRNDRSWRFLAPLFNGRRR